MSDRVESGAVLRTGESRRSPSGAVVLELDDRGVLTLRRDGMAARVLWRCPARVGSGTVTMQRDGNLVLTTPDGTAVWASDTWGNEGAHLRVQDDGNLVVCAAGGSPLWATGTYGAVARTAFRASVHGLPFANAFAHHPGLRVDVAGVPVELGDAGNGMCGGMVHTALDVFVAGGRRPGGATPPSEGPLFDWIGRRLVDSFDLPAGPLRYLHLMAPDTPAQERARQMREAADAVRQAVSVPGGRPVPLGLVTVVSADPGQVGRNHQVLALGHETVGDRLVRMPVYDPNEPGDDEVVLELPCEHEAAGPLARLVNGHGAVKQVFSFFVTPYVPRRPPADLDALVPGRLPVSIHNGTARTRSVRIFRADDAVRLVALTAGEFAVDPAAVERFVLPDDLDRVTVVSDGRVVGTAGAGGTVTIA